MEESSLAPTQSVADTRRRTHQDERARWCTTLRDLLGKGAKEAPALVRQTRQPPSPEARAALSTWVAARALVSQQLNQLSQAIEATRDPEGVPLVALLRAIRMNLSAAPRNRSTVIELQRYLREDDIIEDAEQPNPFGVELSIRAPLLKALESLAIALPE